MSEELHTNNSTEYFYYAGNRFLIDKDVLKDVQVESEVVRIPETVKKIRRQAFLDARLLGRMSILFIPPSVKKIERLSFAGMANLKEVEVQAQITTLEQGMFRNCMDLEFIYLPDTLRKIESRAFENCLKLRGVDLPRVWVQISEDAFLNCVNLKDKRIQDAIEDAQYRRKKEELEIRKARFPHLYAEQESKTKQMQEAHEKKVTEKAENVQDVLPVSVPTVEKSAAEELLEAALSKELQEFVPVQTYEAPSPIVQNETAEARFFIHEGVLERCETHGNCVRIPEGVTALADRVFYGMKELEEISFPSTLTSIGAQALEGTGWLEKEREKSSYVIINGILISAYYNRMIMEAKLPDTVYRIAPYAFYRSEAQLVILPESVREVDACAFIESEVTEIDFSQRGDVILHAPLAVRCSKLRELYFQGPVERIEDDFVEDCPALKRVCLKGVRTAVNKKAFRENVKIWVL